MALRNSTTNSATSATISTAVPAGAAIDDIAILVASHDDTGSTLASLLPAGFTNLAEVDITLDGQSVIVAWKRLTAADSGSYTFGALGIATQSWVCQCVLLSGRHTTNPPVISTSATSNAANASPVSVTANAITAVAGDDVVYVGASDENASGISTGFASSGPYTELQDTGLAFTRLTMALDDNVAAGTTGSVTATLSLSSGAAGWAAWVVRVPSAAPPPVYTQPQSIAVADGATATFTVVHDGTSGQWQDDRSGTFANISGETADSYTTAATDQTYQGRKHRFISTNAGGSTTSSPASLSVIGFPVILWSTAVPSGNDVWLRDPESVSAGGGGPFTITVTQVTETDLAQAIGKLKLKLVTQTTETDLAQAFLTKKLKVIGQVTETDLAQAFLKAKLKTIGQTLETDLAQAIARGGIAISVAQVTETDLAQALLHSKLKLIVQSTETDLAQAIIRGGTAIAISAANETDSAQAIGKLKRLLLVASTETDASQVMVRIKVRSLTGAAETDAAIALARSLKTKGIGVAVEFDLALSITRLGAAAAAARKLRSLGFGLGIYRG